MSIFNPHIQITKSSTREEYEVEDTVKVQEPNLWRVIFHNDDVTHMDFVVFLLTNVFHKTPQEAFTIMLEVHNSGAAIVGLYQHEIAEEKANICMMTAQKEGFPFKTTIEEDI